MKIEKEIIFAAKIDEVRALLNEFGSKHNFRLEDTGKSGKDTKSGHLNKNVGTRKATLVKEGDSHEQKYPITTVYDLAEFGNRTLLKVTVHGWEKLNPEQAQVEMPKVALSLERELSRMKKNLESHS